MINLSNIDMLRFDYYSDACTLFVNSKQDRRAKMLACGTI